MSKDLSQEKRGAPLESESGRTNQQQPSGKEGNGAREGEYKNIETSVNNKEHFNDDYESSAEDELTREEPRTEKEGQTGKS
jgi:hypothetical protein